MGKKIFRAIIILFIVVSSAVFTISCQQDLTGAVASTDLEDRLKYKNHFPFLNGKYEYGQYKDLDEDRNWKNYDFTAINGEYKFIVVTDTHLENWNDFGLKRLPEAVAKHDAKFAVNLGDITQHGTEHDIDLFIEIADSLGVPFYPVIGNHDIYFGNWSVWKNKIGSTNYRVDIKGANTTLLFMDSANAFLGKTQLDWLEFELKKPTGSNVFVFTHSPLFTSGIKMQQITDTREIARLASILRNRADIMFSGHSHQRVESSAGNVRYITFEDFKSSKIYVVVHVKPSGIVTYSFDKL